MVKKLEELRTQGTSLLENLKDVKLKREDILDSNYKVTTDYDPCDCDLCDCHACDCYYD